MPFEMSVSCTPASLTWLSTFRSQLRAHGIYYSASAAAGGIGVFKSVTYALVLKPMEFGVLALVTSIAPFLIYGISRGLLEASTIELPKLYGGLRNAEGAGLLLAGLRRFVVESCLWSMVSLVALIASGSRAVVFLVVPYAATTGALSLLMSDARSRGNLTKYGSSIFLKTMLCAIFGLVFAVRMGAAGVILGETGAQFVLAVWLYWGERAAATLPIMPGSRELSQIRAKGQSIMLHQAFQLLSQNSDKWLVSLALGAAVVGQYSFAGIFLVGVSLLHSIVYQQIGPAAVRNSADSVSIVSGYRHLGKIAVLLGAAVGGAGVLAWVLFFVAVRYFNVPYQIGLAVFPWIAASAVLQSMNHFDWIVALGPNMPVLARWSGSCVVGFIVFGCLGVIVHFPLWYFALLALLYRFIALIISWVLAYRTALPNESCRNG